MAKKPEKGDDELDMLKASLLKKDLDVITITDKMRRLEDRSQSIVGSMEKLSNGAREKIATLTDIIGFLTRYLKIVAQSLVAVCLTEGFPDFLFFSSRLIMNCSFSEGNVKDTRIVELEEAYAKSEQDRKDTVTQMNKQLADVTSAHEFQLDSMKLKLEAANVRVRETQDFAVKKKVAEDENAAYV